MKKNKIEMLYLIDHPYYRDPAINLALEEYLMRHLDLSHDYFLVYVNQPCVVVGRHQNIFEEVNYPLCIQFNLPVVRRISGGGTVYHDEGNVNFSFITRYERHKFNNYRYFNAPILKVLHSLGVKAELNGRNDIIVNQKKISGNAQFTSKDRMLSHGTLLYSADLERIHSLLHHRSGAIQSRAIKSVRSNIVNISQLMNQPLNMESFIRLLIKSVFAEQGEIPLYCPTTTDWKDIFTLSKDKYQSWEWNFGESPDFTFQNTITNRTGRITVQLEMKRGCIADLKLSNMKFLKVSTENLKKKLIGARYDMQSVSHALEDLRLQPDQKKMMIRLFFGDSV